MRAVVYGSGGVGKTTTAAALAVTLAQQGARTLVITMDPARRLGDALGGVASESPSEVAGCPGLTCVAPEAAGSMALLMRELLRDDPALELGLRGNPVFQLLASGLAGMHELVALGQLTSLAARYDALVIDTAPSRHAIDLVGLPTRLRAIIDSRALTWLGQLADPPPASGPSVMRRLRDWGQRRIVASFETAVGPTTVRDTLEVLRAITLARPRLAEIAAAGAELLSGPTTRYVVVIAPRHGAEHEARWFTHQLAEVARTPSAFVFNRALAVAPSWLASAPIGHAPPIAAAFALARAEAEASIAALADVTRAAARVAPAAQLVRVAPSTAATPRGVVDEVAPQLAEFARGLR